MKKLLAAMFVALLMGGCGGEAKKPAEDSTESNASSVETPPAKTAEIGGIDLDDNETLAKIIAGAIDLDKLERRGKKGERADFAPNSQTPYTGWAKVMWGNGQIRAVGQYKDGKPEGFAIEWYRNGQKKSEENFKYGKPDGIQSNYYENGQKESVENWKDGKQDGLATMWYSTGQKAGETYYKDGVIKPNQKLFQKNGQIVLESRNWDMIKEQVSRLASRHSNDTEKNASALAPKVVQPVKDGFVEKWSEWEAHPEPYGGLKALAKIKKAKESGATSLNLQAKEGGATSLNLHGNEITDVSPLVGLTNLEELSLDGNQITEISPLAGLTKLEHLWIRDNKISDLSPLAGLTNLEVLHLGKNNITDLSPLKGLTQLEELYLGRNKISDVTPLAELTKLERLTLNINKISDLSPLKGLTQLEELYLDNNKISEEQKAMIRKALPNCDISL